MTTFDILTNPLRTDHPFGKPLQIRFTQICIEIWAPKEIAMFEACICKFGKRFALFEPYVSQISVDF